jgi:hypothetical protein
LSNEDSSSTHLGSSSRRNKIPPHRTASGPGKLYEKEKRTPCMPQQVARVTASRFSSSAQLCVKNGQAGLCSLSSVCTIALGRLLHCACSARPVSETDKKHETRPRLLAWRTLAAKATNPFGGRGLALVARSRGWMLLSAWLPPTLTDLLAWGSRESPARSEYILNAYS